MHIVNLQDHFEIRINRNAGRIAYTHECTHTVLLDEGCHLVQRLLGVDGVGVRWSEKRPEDACRFTELELGTGE